jgi:hypothetical protein
MVNAVFLSPVGVLTVQNKVCGAGVDVVFVSDGRKFLAVCRNVS